HEEASAGPGRVAGFAGRGYRRVSRQFTFDSHGHAIYPIAGRLAGVHRLRLERYEPEPDAESSGVGHSRAGLQLRGDLCAGVEIRMLHDSRYRLSRVADGNVHHVRVSEVPASVSELHHHRLAVSNAVSPCRGG